ncbi:uncharacterized protein LOC122320591 [Drosophila ficusphila]|uniref:uncharacterized protein LOC122320591 n=1 Tax=Drosophila ficusphila TaxID=30025 RepID=UPI001C893AC4|nr:uncharacterized protein LOC122320591 [Drosophila ficusphila]
MWDIPHNGQLSQSGNVRDQQDHPGWSKVKWYLRYLQQGMTLDEALRKAKGGTASGPPATPLTGTHTSYAEATKRVRVAVLPEEYPQVHLSHEELSELEEAIMDDVVMSAWDTAVAFRAIHFRVGYLLIECLDQDSADWLRAFVPQLRTWKGLPLGTRVGEDIPAVFNVTVFCPRSAERSNEELLMMFGRQNKLKTDAWKVISRKNDGGGALLVIGIDQLTRDEIVSKGHQLDFRFGTVSVSDLRRAEKKAAANEAPSGPTVGKEVVEDSLVLTDGRSEDEEHLMPFQGTAQDPSLDASCGRRHTDGRQ